MRKRALEWFVVVAGLYLGPSARSEKRFECVSEEEREEARRRRQGWTAFQRSPIPVPPLLYVSRDRSFVEAMLLYWSWTNAEEGTKLRLLFPFMLQTCTPATRTLVTPLFGWREDAKGTAGLIGPFFFRRDRDAQTDALFPFFGRFADESGSTTIALNFYLRKHAGSGDWDAGLVPLYFGARHGDDTRLLSLAPPLYYFGSKEGWDLGIVPLYFGGREGERYYDVVPPLFGRWGDAHTRTVVAGPFYRRTHEENGDWDAGLVPLYFGARHGESYFHSVLPPLVTAWGDAQTRTVVAGTFYQRSHRVNGDWDAGLVPLYFGARHGESYFHSVLPPLVTAWGDAQTRTVVAGTFYQRSHRASGDWDAGLAPLYFGARHGDDTSFFSLAPPLYYLRNAAGWSAGILPLYFGGRSGERYYDVAPLFARWGDAHTSTVVAGTFYRRSHEVNGDWDAGLAPLYFAARHGDDTRFLSLAPPAYYLGRKDGWDLGIAPLYFGGRAGERYYDVVPSLFARWGDAHTSTVVAGTFYRRSHEVNGDWDAGLAPLYFAARHGDDTRFLSLAPPAYYLGRKDGWDLGIAPLYFGGRAGERYYDVVPSLFARWGDAHTSTVVAGTFYRRSHEVNGDWDAGLAPLYFAARHGDDTRFLSLAPPAYYLGRKDGWDLGIAPLYFGGRAGERYYDVVPSLFARWGDAHTSTVVAGTFYRRSHEVNGDWDAGLAPLYFGARHGDSYYHTVLPPLFAAWGDAHTSTILAAPFYRRAHDTGDWDAGLAPLYFGARHGDSFYHAVLPPLFSLWGDKEETRILALAPPTYYARNKDGWDLGIVPLYFGRRAGDHYYDVVPPLFARWGDRDRHALLAGPFYRLESPGRERFGFFPLYFGGRGHGDDYYDVVPPLLMRWGDARAHTTVIPPAFYHRHEGGFDAGFFPLLFLGRDAARDRRYTHVPPLLWHWGDADGTRALLFPLAYYRRDGRDRLFLSPLSVFHEVPDEHIQRLVIFPVWWHFSNPGRDVDVGFPLWWDVRWPQEGARFSVLAPFGFRYEKAEETTTVFLNMAYTRGKGNNAEAWSFHLFPVLSLSSYNHDHFRWQFLYGLAGRERQGETSRWQAFWIWTNPS